MSSPGDPNKAVARATLAFVVVTSLSCVPNLWLLTLTPMHDGSDTPSNVICMLAAGLSLFLGVIAYLIVLYNRARKM